MFRHSSNFFEHRPGWGPGLVALLLSLFAFLISPFIQAQDKKGLDNSKLQIVAARLDGKGRLWRLLTGQQHVYVDYSDDLANTFSPPVKVNQQPQKILTTSEDRPALAIAADGQMAVIYASNRPYNYSRYYSHSIDGQHFSTPLLISGKRRDSGHSQDQVIFDRHGQLYLFWIQERRGYPAQLKVSRSSLLDNPVASVDILVDSMCDCCRLGLALDQQNMPQVLGRFVFADNIRDMGITGFTPGGKIKAARRVSDDEWRLNACPHHGPSLSIDDQNRYHIVWFTQGRKRQGLFYAASDDAGESFSLPVPFGNPLALPSHADILAVDNRVVIVWREYDGKLTRILGMESPDRGQHWGPVRTLLESHHEGDHPFLIHHEEQIYLSWDSIDSGYQLIAIETNTDESPQ